MAMELVAILQHIRRGYGPELVPPRYRKLRPSNAPAFWGNCYPAAEALFHLWGKKRGWIPAYIRYTVGGIPATHWVLVKDGVTIDPTADQFEINKFPNYRAAIGCGFLTKRPSRRTRLLMRKK
jgi:hypothetical protein